MPAVGNLGEAMQAAGVTRPETADTRLRNMAVAALNQPDPLGAFILALNSDPEATLVLFSIDEISARAKLKLDELAREEEMPEGKGQPQSTKGRPPVTLPLAHATKSSGAVAGHGAVTDGLSALTPASAA